MVTFADLQALGINAFPENREDLNEIARDVAGDRHHFRAVQLPVNFQMLEALGRANQPAHGDHMHSVLQVAAEHGLADGDWVTAESRRGSLTVRCQVVATIRPDTVFVPYHWGGDKSVNLATIAAQDPVSKIPEYKVCAVRIKRADAPPEYAGRLEPQQ